jgi:hypothetical protein
VPHLRRARTRTEVAVLALAGLVALGAAAGCSGPSASEQRADLLREARATIGAYVGALDRGDLAAADALRCRAAQLPAEERAAHLAPVVDQLRRELGGLRVQELGIVNRIEGVAHVEVRLAGGREPVYPALVEERGRLRICGASVEPAALARASEKVHDGVAATSGATLDALAGVAPVPGFTAEPGDAAPPGLLEQLDGFVAGRGARWRADDGSGRTISITVVDLDSPQRARAAQRLLEDELGDAVVDRFDVPSPAARAFRYLAGYQLLLQPPDAGPVGDYVGLRWGSRIALVYAVPLGHGDDHGLALAVAAELAAAADAG